MSREVSLSVWPPDGEPKPKNAWVKLMESARMW